MSKRSLHKLNCDEKEDVPLLNPSESTLADDSETNRNSTPALHTPKEPMSPSASLQSVNAEIPQESSEKQDDNDNPDDTKETQQQSSSQRQNSHSLVGLKFDPQLALLLEDHLRFLIPWFESSECCNCCGEGEGGNDDDEVTTISKTDDKNNYQEIIGDKKKPSSKWEDAPLLRISPAISFLIYTLLFYFPLIFSSLKPLYFPPKVAEVGNFDQCSWFNTSAAAVDSGVSSLTCQNNNNDNNNANLLVQIDFIDCIRCNKNQGYVQLQPALTEMTSLSLSLIILRIFISAGIGSFVFCRCYFERALSLRLLAFGVIVAPPPKRQLVGDLAIIIACVIGVAYQLAYLRNFAPPDLNCISLGTCDVPSIMTQNPVPDFANQTIVAHFNQSTVDSLYHVASPETELFTFCSLLVPFILGPIFSIIKHQEPLSLLDSTLAIEKNSKQNFASRIAKKMDENSFAVKYLSRVSLLKIPRLMCMKRSWCEFWVDAVCASLPIPVNYCRRLMIGRENAHVQIKNDGDANEGNNKERHQWSFDEVIDYDDTHHHHHQKCIEQQRETLNTIKHFMEYELGKHACEFYLVSEEEASGSSHQFWIWAEMFGIIFFSLVFMSVYFLAIPPNLTFKDLTNIEYGF